MAYYHYIRNNVAYFIRNIICRRDGYAKQDCVGYKSHLDCISDNELISGIFCCQSERCRYCAWRLSFNYTHVDVGYVYVGLELYS